MPHKHTRKDKDKDTANFDLPPTVTAQPLPVSKAAAANGIFSSSSAPRSNKKRKRSNPGGSDGFNDTPKAFARLMAFQDGKRLPRGLDDGSTTARPRRAAASKPRALDDMPEPTPATTTAAAAAAAASTPRNEVPTIRPGERLSEFAARVDAALPVSGSLVRKGNKDPLGLKVKRTRKEQQMHRLYAEWRSEDVKLREQRDTARDDADDAALWDESGAGAAEGALKTRVDMAYDAAQAAARKKKGRKGKKRKGATRVDDGDDDADPWAAVARARNEAPRKLNDVVQAPPEQLITVKEKFKPRRR